MDTSRSETTTASPAALELRCEACGAVIAVESGHSTARCVFCDTPSVLTLPAGPNREQPVFALGFSVDRETAVRSVGRWIRQRRTTRLGLKRSVAERIAGVYLPAYLYSAAIRSQYQASIAETYRKVRLEGNDDGGVSLRTRDETEWRDLAGPYVGYVSDTLVTASRSVTNQLLAAIEPFDVSALRRYTPALVVGWSAEVPSLAREDCLHLARSEALSSVASALGGFMPGDHHRSLRHQTELVDESIDLTLVPVWIFSLRYNPRKPPIQVLVNGQTARVGGDVPFSWLKLGIIVGAALVLIGALLAVALALGLFR